MSAPLQRLTLILLVAVLGLSGLGAQAERTTSAPQPAARIDRSPQSELNPPPTRLAETEVFLRTQPGDDPAWSHPDFDDRSWPIEPLRRRPFIGAMALHSKNYFIPSRAGIRWLRLAIFIPDPAHPALSPPPEGSLIWPQEQPDGPVNGLYMALPMAYEVFWDGQRLLRSGVVSADRDGEVAGPLDQALLIPDRLRSPGLHQLALRLSTWRYNFPATSFDYNLSIRNYTQLLIYENQRALFPVVASVTAFFFALVCGILFTWVERRRPLLICGLLSLSIAVFYLLVALRWLLPELPYSWFFPRLVAATVMMTLIGLLMPWLLLEFFLVPHKRRWILALSVPLVAAWFSSPIYEIISLWSYRAAIATSILISAWAMWKRRPWAWVVLAGLALCLVSVQTARRSFLDPTFFFAFNGLVLFLLLRLGFDLRDDRRQSQRAKLTAARLEIELLKKNLQPHFLLNTLTALMEVIEQSPATAVRLIDDLAGEFRLFTALSAERTVPLAQELELCRAHLRVVGVRSGAVYRLETQDVDLSLQVPPGLLLTLIENAFSHQRLTQNNTTFVLREHLAHGRRKLEFFSPGEIAEHATRLGGGTGLRYVKARLEESFPGHWSLEQGPFQQGWRTVILIEETEKTLS